MAVAGVDQSLFAAVKSTQWQWLEIYDENQIYSDVGWFAFE